MEKIILTGLLNSKEKKEKVTEFSKLQELELTVLKDQEVLIVPTDSYEKESFFKNEIKKMKKVTFYKLIEDFFDTYVISFKKNKEEMPSFFQIIIGSEYNDNGGSYSTIEEIHFFDENKKRVSYDFLVENLWGDEDSIEYALDVEITESFDVDYITELFDWNEYIKIPKGE